MRYLAGCRLLLSVALLCGCGSLRSTPQPLERLITPDGLFPIAKTDTVRSVAETGIALMSTRRAWPSSPAADAS